MQAGLGMLAGWGTFSCDSWQVSQVSAACALLANFCPCCSGQELQTGGAASPAAYRSAPATPVIRPKTTEPSRRPKEVNARFFTRLGSQGRPAGELPIDIGGSEQKTENDGDHRQDFAPFVDDIEFLGEGRLLRECTVHDVQAIVLISGDRLPPEEQRQHTQGESDPDY